MFAGSTVFKTLGLKNQRLLYIKLPPLSCITSAILSYGRWRFRIESGSIPTSGQFLGSLFFLFPKQQEMARATIAKKISRSPSDAIESVPQAVIDRVLMH
jgi:hypothetical protein